MRSTIAATESAVSYGSVRVDNLDIFYRESGPKDGPTILLLHGLPSSSRMFQPLLEFPMKKDCHRSGPFAGLSGKIELPTRLRYELTFCHSRRPRNGMWEHHLTSPSTTPISG
jgi:hypothetical protein